jgi:hypothetical protein
MNNAVRYRGWSFYRAADRNWIITDPHGATIRADKLLTDRDVRRMIDNETALTRLEVSF